jgi:hypothetical protein
MTHSTLRAFHSTYIGPRCPIDGCRTRYSHSHKCTECVAYVLAIKAGRIEGEDGRKIPRTGLAARKIIDEAAIGQYDLRSSSISGGIAASKKRKFLNPTVHTKETSDA